MEDELRHSGIDMIGSVPWGTHFCQFYHTKQDLVDILVPYFKAGLENNEFCMWITSEPLIVTEAQEAMREAVDDFDRCRRRGQIEIIPYSEWYLLVVPSTTTACSLAGLASWSRLWAGVTPDCD